MRGVTFGEKHSFLDYGLYMKSYPEIEPPEPRTITVDIPGGNGSIDLTECLTGDVQYKTRKIKIEFLVIHARERWPEVYSRLMDDLHGQRMQIIFDNDTEYCYEGRLSVKSMTASKKTSVITVEAEVDPYKYEIKQTETSYTVNGTLNVTMIGTKRPSVLNVTSSANMTVTKDGKQYAVKSGNNLIADIVIREGTNTLQFAGNGTITIYYRGGRL